MTFVLNYTPCPAQHTMPLLQTEKLYIMPDSGLIHYFPGDDIMEPPVYLGRLGIAKPLGYSLSPSGECNPETDRMLGRLTHYVMALGFGDIARPPYHITVEQAEAHNMALEDLVVAALETGAVGAEVSLTYVPAHGETKAHVKYGTATVANQVKYRKGNIVSFVRFGNVWEGKVSQRGQPENVAFVRRQ